LTAGMKRLVNLDSSLTQIKEIAMTQHDIAARAPNYVVCVLTAIALVSLVAYSQTKGKADDKARAHVEQQAKAQMGGRE
jgi:hypothetical protein